MQPDSRSVSSTILKLHARHGRLPFTTLSSLSGVSPSPAAAAAAVKPTLFRATCVSNRHSIASTACLFEGLKKKRRYDKKTGGPTDRPTDRSEAHENQINKAEICFSFVFSSCHTAKPIHNLLRAARPKTHTVPVQYTQKQHAQRNAHTLNLFPTNATIKTLLVLRSHSPAHTAVNR